MKNAKLTWFSLILLFLMSFSVFSYNILLDYGNSELLTSGCGYTQFSSCYPQSDLTLNFSKTILSQSMSVEPIIYYHQNSLSSLANQKFLYTFSTTNMYSYYTSNFQLYNTNTLKGSILFTPSFVRDDDIFKGYLLVYPYSINGEYHVNVCDADTDGNICKNSDLDFIISNKTVDFIVDRARGNMVTLLQNGTIEVYDLVGIKTNVINLGFNVSTPTKTPPNVDKYLSIDDFDTDGFQEITFVIPSVYYSGGSYYVIETLGIYDLDNEVYDLAPMNVTVLSCLIGFCATQPSVVNSRVTYTTIGSLSSTPKINIFVSYAYNWGGVVNRRSNFLYSTNGIQVYSDNIGASTTSILNTNGVTSDINYDGYNEFCTIRGDASANYRLFCYDSGFNQVYNVSTSQQLYLSMGKFTNDTYMSIMLRDGIYNYNGTALDKIYNFTLSASDDLTLPISMFNKVNYSNDVFIIGTNQLISYKLSSPSAVCGDNICSITETPLICPSDCFTEEQNIINVSKKAPTLPCQNDNQCLSNNCNNGYCTFLTTGQSCTIDSQCLSQDCYENKCSQASWFQTLNSEKTSLVGDDQKSSDLISIIIILAVAIILGIIVFAITQHGVASLIGFLVGGFVTLILLTVFEWISPFYLIALIILSVFAVMVWFFTKSGSGN